MLFHSDKNTSYKKCSSNQTMSHFQFRFVCAVIAFISLLANLSMNNLSGNVRKRTFWHVRPTKTLIRLRIRAVWLESSLSAWKSLASVPIENAASEYSGQTARMRRLIWIITGRTSPKVRFLTLRLIWSQKRDMYCLVFLHMAPLWLMLDIRVLANWKLTLRYKQSEKPKTSLKIPLYTPVKIFDERTPYSF